MDTQDLIRAAIGGVFIGGSAAGLLVLHGKIAGISGMIYGAVKPLRGDVAWRVTFLLGMVTAGAIAALSSPALVDHDLDRSALALVAAGLLVGFGTRLGGGCTSGHALCGVGAFSIRSLIATLTFITAGIASVWIVRTAFGGAL